MKISELDSERGFEVAAKAMPLIMKLKYNPDTEKAWEEASEQIRAVINKPKDKEKSNGKELALITYTYFTKMLLNEKEAAIELFSLINGKTTDEYKATMNAATAIADITDAFIYDDDLMRLFGLRTQTVKPSSGSASENTQGKGK